MPATKGDGGGGEREGEKGGREGRKERNEGKCGSQSVELQNLGLRLIKKFMNKGISYKIYKSLEKNCMIQTFIIYITDSYDLLKVFFGVFVINIEFIVL